MGFCRQLENDSIVGLDNATFQNCAHDACASRLLTSAIALSPHMLLQSGLVLINLRTRCAKTRDLQKGICSYVQSCSQRKTQQVQPVGEDVLAKFAGVYGEATQRELVQLLRAEQVHLAKVWLRWILPHAIEMLCCNSAVGVAFDTLACNQPNVTLRHLRKAVLWVEGHSDNTRQHPTGPIAVYGPSDQHAAA